MVTRSQKGHNNTEVKSHSNIRWINDVHKHVAKGLSKYLKYTIPSEGYQVTLKGHWRIKRGHIWEGHKRSRSYRMEISDVHNMEGLDK